jgi:hypothetical protein
MVIIPGRYERVLISRSTSMKVEVSKRPNGLGAGLAYSARGDVLALYLATKRRARAYHLFVFVRPLERVDVLLFIAHVREPVDVCFQRQPRKHLLALSSSEYEPNSDKSRPAARHFPLVGR